MRVYTVFGIDPFDGTNYILSDVSRTIANLEYLDSNDPQKVNYEHMEPSEFNSFLTVSPSLVREGRPDDQTVPQGKPAGQEEGSSEEAIEAGTVHHPATNGGILSIDNDGTLKELVSLDHDDDRVRIESIARSCIGRTIQLELITAFVEPYRDYNTRFNYLLYAVQGDNVMLAGPAFLFENVSYYDLKLTGDNQPDVFDVGIHSRVTAEVVGYDDDMIRLDPVSIEVIRQY